jgi:hypothetical protein
VKPLLEKLCACAFCCAPIAAPLTSKKPPCAFRNSLYVGLFVPAPTLLWDDKEFPNVPLSQINVVDGRPTPGSVQVLRESLAGESSIPLGGPVSGVISLNLQIR